MKSSIKLAGTNYDSSAALIERFQICAATLYRWKRRGVLPAPVKIGTVNYYMRREVERLLASPQSGANPTDTTTTE